MMSGGAHPVSGIPRPHPATLAGEGKTPAWVDAIVTKDKK